MISPGTNLIKYPAGDAVAEWFKVLLGRERFQICFSAWTTFRDILELDSLFHNLRNFGRCKLNNQAEKNVSSAIPLKNSRFNFGSSSFCSKSFVVAPFCCKMTEKLACLF